MSGPDGPYADARAVESSIRSAALVAAERSGRDVDRLIREARFDRFLCRVFIAGGDRFLLKGGTGMLARIPEARATRDIDLAAASTTIGQAVTDLRAAAAHDLHDFFRFEYLDHKPLLAGDNQPYTDGVRVRFRTYVGVSLRDTIGIDLVTGPAPVTDPVVQEPANRLPLPRLTTTTYRLISIEEQIADKVCASRGTYGTRGGPSTRVKDLVDLVAIALTQTVDGATLQQALHAEQARRQLPPATTYIAPASTGHQYRDLATASALTHEFRDLTDAVPLVAHLVEPALNGDVQHKTWNPHTRTWQQIPSQTRLAATPTTRSLPARSPL